MYSQCSCIPEEYIMWFSLLGGIAAYFVGNISPAIILGKLHGVDIKKEGSGNAGTTNVLRVLGKKAAVVTLLTDVLKGTVSVVACGLIIGQIGAMIGVIGVFIGHIWPIVYGFKGGKGVATAFGALAGLNPMLGFSALGIVALGVLISRRMSFGSLMGAVSCPLICYWIEREFIYYSMALAAIVLWKHRENIKRLIKGEEPKLGDKK